MSELEMPTPCSTCGVLVELNDTPSDSRGRLYCEPHGREAQIDDEWEQAALDLDTGANLDIEWAVQFDKPHSFESECVSELAAREFNVEATAAGHANRVVARRVITGPWETR